MIAGAFMVYASPRHRTPALRCDHGLRQRPASVVKAFQAERYKALLGKSGATGNPRIESAASGYKFFLFHECEKGVKCGSLQLQLSFADDGKNTPALANKWNNAKRFLQMSVDNDKSLAVAMDVAMIGGLNQKNFVDVLDWWSTMLDELNKFFKEESS